MKHHILGWPVVVQELHRTLNTQNNFIPKKKHSLMKRPNATAPLQEIISFSSWARLKNLMPLFHLGKIFPYILFWSNPRKTLLIFFHWVTCQCLPEVMVFPKLFHTGFLKQHFLEIHSEIFFAKSRFFQTGTQFSWKCKLSYRCN